MKDYKLTNDAKRNMLASEFPEKRFDKLTELEVERMFYEQSLIRPLFWARGQMYYDTLPNTTSAATNNVIPIQSSVLKVTFGNGSVKAAFVDGEIDKYAIYLDWKTASMHWQFELTAVKGKQANPFAKASSGKVKLSPSGKHSMMDFFNDVLDHEDFNYLKGLIIVDNNFIPLARFPSTDWKKDVEENGFLAGQWCFKQMSFSEFVSANIGRTICSIDFE